MDFTPVELVKGDRSFVARTPTQYVEAIYGRGFVDPNATVAPADTPTAEPAADSPADEPDNTPADETPDTAPARRRRAARTAQDGDAA